MFSFTFRFVIYESEYEILRFINVPIILLVFISLDTRFKGVEVPKVYLIRMRYRRFFIFRKVYLYFKGSTNEIIKVKVSLTWLCAEKQDMILKDINFIIRKNNLEY